jgi:type IV secretory pathway TraG/TraD family ATPase VirD4
MNMQTHNQSFLKLRALREQASTVPKRGKPKKSHDNIIAEILDVDIEKLQIFGGISVAITALCVGYLSIRNVPPLFTFNTSLQLIIFVFSLCFSLNFYRFFFSFRPKKAFSVLSEKDYTIQYIVCVNITYFAYRLFEALPTYVSDVSQNGFFSNITILDALFPNLVGMATHNFYIGWLSSAFVLFLCISAIKAFSTTKTAEKNKTESKGKFKLWLGISTGILAKLSHGAGISAKQHILITQEDASQNIIIMGGIGSGKTSRTIHPILMQLVDQDCGGLIFDIKGNFHHAVNTIFEVANRTNQLKIIGEIGGKGRSFNLIEGLTPEIAASFLKSSLMLSGTRAADSFWLDTASDLCRNILGVLSFLKEHYNLSSLHEYLFDKKHRDMINEEADAQLQTLEHSQQRLLNSYRNYYENIFSKYDERVQTGVLASVEQILSTFSHPLIADMFCKHSDVSMNEVLEGTVFLVNLPLADWGLGAKVIYNLIKLRFFNVMQQRENKLDWNQDRPVFFMCDEYQEVVSGNKDGLSDLNFWDKARSSKTIGIISTQSVSSFYAAIGNRVMANALLQNFRQKIIYRTEDQATLDLLNRLTGNVDVERRSVSKQSGSSSGGSLNSSENRHRSKTESTTWVTKPVLDPQQVRTLDQDQAIAILVISGNSCDDILNMPQIHF